MGHHRIHAAQHLSDAAERLSEGLGKYTQWSDDATIPTVIAPGQFNGPSTSTSLFEMHESILQYFNEVTVDIPAAAALVADVTPGKLDEAHRLLSEPDGAIQFDAPGTPVAVIRKLRHLWYYMGLLTSWIDSNGDDWGVSDNLHRSYLQQAHVGAANAWRDVDYALWHVNDAIREDHHAALILCVDNIMA